MRVPKELIRQYNNVHDVDGVRARKVNQLRRRVFHAAGVNHLWAMDQHDKWKKYGLRLHLCIEPFTGKLLWLVIWWTNSNPKFVARQYFRAAKTFGGIPLLTQSDMGTENYGVAYSQTNIRHCLDPTLRGTLQHNWMSGHRNIKPEASWWRLRNSWTPGFEDMLERGVVEQWYNPENIIDSLVFRWLAIPFLQRELDSYVHLHNTTARRANHRKTLPHGVPDTMFEYPQTVGALDFKITVPDDVLEDAEAEYAPPSDPVFEIVPPAFQVHISSAYTTIGSPTITFDSFWNIYRQLRDAVDHTLTSLQAAANSIIPTEEYHDPEPLPFPTLQQVRFGENGIPRLVVNLSQGPADNTRAEFETNFTDDEEEIYPGGVMPFTDDDGSKDDVPVASFTDNRVNELY